MGIPRSAGWEEDGWDDAVQWHEREEEDGKTMEQRTWELIKGDYEFLPDCLKSLATWGDVYRCAYASFSAHKATICQAEAPTHIVFGPETWERINVSAEFKHSLLCLSRWYDDLVKGAVDSYDDLYLRDIAVYRRHNKHYILDPRMLSFDVLPPGCNSNHSHSTVPVETVVSLAAAANETAAQQSACALDSWKLPWRNLFVRMPLRRLLTLDDDTCINSWLCGTAEFDFSDAEGSDGDLGIDTASLQRQRTASILQGVLQPLAGCLEAGEALHLARSAAADIPSARPTTSMAVEALRRHARGGIRSQLSAPEHPFLQPRGGDNAMEWKKALLARVLGEIRRCVFLGVTDEEIADGSAEATLLYLSDSDVWQDGPGTNEHQPAANVVFFHSDMAVLITSHVPHC